LGARTGIHKETGVPRGWDQGRGVEALPGRDEKTACAREKKAGWKGSKGEHLWRA